MLKRRALIGAVSALLLALAGTGTAAAKHGPPPDRPGKAKGHVVDVQILAFNDFHGNLEPPSGSSGRVGTVDAGGVEYLATHIRQLEQTNKNTIVVSAGDLIGASPLVSALFHDEPTIEAMNRIGLDLNAVGNHEFDEGTDELLRMQNGGCHPVDGCLDGDGFRGAKFRFLAANVVSRDTGETLFPPYHIEKFKGAPVAFIGMTLEGTPTIVSPSGIAGYEFLDEADTVNALVPELRAKGVEAIVVLVHEGGTPTALDINGCAGVSGPIVDIVQRLDPAVDLVISGHTHQPYNCVLAGKPVTSAFSFGRLVTDIDLQVNRKTGDVATVAINNRIVTRDVTPAADMTSLIERYRVLSEPIANRPIGHITADLLRAQEESGEQVLGNVIADAQLAATDDPDTGAAQVAFMNPGGVRADLTFASSAAGEGDGVVTFGEAFTVQPFGNSLVTMTLTGAQIELMLEQQFCGINSPANGGFARVLSPSAGFAYTWDQSEAGAADCATADAVDPATITLNGQPLDLAASYRVTVNSFLADGGDGFEVLREGTDRLGGAVDLDAFEAYLAAAEPDGISPPPLDRVSVVP
ncbi:MAG TPA: bifunctional metallophosphatase/5'-nucleotidase [Acidimicrobiales bacterium]